MHKSQAALAQELKKAAERVSIGGYYRHYKNPTDAYKVIDLAVTEWDGKMCVIYEAQYGEKLTFVRPLESWLDEVEWDNRIVKRFTLIKSP